MGDKSLLIIKLSRLANFCMLVEKAFLKKIISISHYYSLWLYVDGWTENETPAFLTRQMISFHDGLLPGAHLVWAASSRKPLKKRQRCILGRRGGATYLSWYFLLLEPLLFGVYNPLLQLFTSSLLWRSSHENYTLGFPVLRGSLPGSPCVSSWQIKADRLCWACFK